MKRFLALAFGAILALGAARAGEVTYAEASAKVNNTQIYTCYNSEPPVCCCCEFVMTGTILDFCWDDQCIWGYYSFGNSRIVNHRLSYEHSAQDYSTDGSERGCAPCGSTAANRQMGQLPSLELKRVTRFRGNSQQSSLSPGHFLSYDVTLQLYSMANGGYIYLWDPLTEYQFKLEDTTNSGVYTDRRQAAFKDIRLYDASMNPVTTVSAAHKAVLTTLHGQTYTFEVITISGAKKGRMANKKDRNGNALTINWVYPYNASDATLNNDRTNLWKMSSIVDAYGRTATITYKSTKILSKWVIERIDLPNAQYVTYNYNATTGLDSVTHPDGTTTTIAWATDAGTQCTKVSFDDAAADGVHRRKDVYITNSTWVDPNTSQSYAQESRRVRMVVNGAGEVSYMNWVLSEGSSTYGLMIYEGGGALHKYRLNGATPLSNEFARNWTGLNQDPATMTWELDETYTVDAYKRVTAKVDNLGRTTSNVRDAVTGFPTSRTHPDTTTESYTYNSFNLVTRHVDRLGRITDYTYDAAGNMLTKVVAVGTADEATWTWEYNAKGQPVKAKDPLYNATYTDLHVTEYEYNASGYLTKIKEAADATGGPRAETLFTYDAAGRVTQISAPPSDVSYAPRLTSFAYDTRNRVTTITYNDSTTDVFAYGTGTNANLLVQKTDRLGNVEKCDFDLAGRETTCTLAFGKPEAVQRVCTYLVGTAKRKTCVDRGELTTYGFDYRLRPVSTARQASTVKTLTSSTAFDKARRVDYTQDEYERKTYFVYDINNRVTRTVRETVKNALTLPLPPTDPNYQTQRDTYLNGLARVLTPNAAYLIDESAYDAEGQVTSSTNARNIRDTYAYDGQGRMTVAVASASEYNSGTSTYDPTLLAARTEYTFDKVGNVTQVKHPRSFRQQSGGTFAAGSEGDFITKHTFNGRNLTTSTTVAFGRAEAATESFAYAPDQKPIARTDGRGNVWNTVFSQCCGYHKINVDPAADVDGNTGTGDTRAASVGNRDSLNHVTHAYVVSDYSALPYSIVHDPVATLKEATTRLDGLYRPSAQSVWLVELGLVSKNAPPIAGDVGFPATDGLTTRWVYDDNMTDGSGLDATYSAYLTGLNYGSGSDGSAVESTNPEGEKAVTFFDGLGRVIRTVRVNGGVSTSITASAVYDQLVAGTPGELLETQQVLYPNGFGGSTIVTKSRMDGAGRELATVDAVGQVTTFSHDANGNRVAFRDPNNVGMDCTFDARDRDIFCVDTQGDKTVKLYDNHNNLRKTLDGKGSAALSSGDALTKQKNYDFSVEAHAVTCGFDGRDRKITCTDRIGGSTVWTFDANSNNLALTDAESRTTLYTYDARNMRTKETYPDHNLPDNGEVHHAFDAAHRPIKRIDQVPDTTTLVYDRADRLLQRIYPDSLNDTFTYDAASRLLTGASGRYNNTVTRAYDDAGRMTSETLTLGGQNYTTASAFDAASRRTGITYPDGKVVAQAFTDRHQLSSVSYNGSNVVTLAYDNGMRQSTKTFTNGKVETRTYRADDRLTQIQTPGVTDFTFTYDANKNPLTKNFALDTTDNQTYTYDDEDRLTNFARQSGFTQAWTLSLAGDWNSFNNNGSAETRTHNQVHELSQINATPLTHDKKGNLTANSNGQTHTWDFENCMKTAVVGANTATYEYDVFRRRVKKSFSGVATVYTYDGWRCVAEYENGAAPSAPARAYVFGTYLDEALMMVTAPAGAATKRYHHADQLYSVYALTDAAGAVVERNRYEAYGKCTVLTAAFVPKADPNYSEFGNPFTFTGQRLDKETALLYYKNRYYSTGLGRFVSRDPIGYDAGSFNLYLYCYLRPLVFVDPVGLECDLKGAFIKVAGKVIVAIGVKIGGAKVKRWAVKAAAASAIDGPLPVGEIVSGIMAAWDTVEAISEIADAKGFAKQAFNYMQSMMEVKFDKYVDCLDERPECCELVKNAIDRAGNAVAADITAGRPIGKTLKKLTDVAEDLLKDLAKCCLKPCDLPKIPQKRGHRGGNDWDKHSGRRSGDPEKGDLRREY